MNAANAAVQSGIVNIRQFATARPDCEIAKNARCGSTPPRAACPQRWSTGGQVVAAVGPHVCPMAMKRVVATAPHAPAIDDVGTPFLARLPAVSDITDA